MLAEGYTDVLALHQAGIENAVGITLAGQHGVDYLPGQLVVERPRRDERGDPGDLRGSDRERGQFGACLVGAPGQLAQPPLAGVGRRRARRDRLKDELERAGVGREAVTVIPVPGAFELPLAAMALAKTRRYSCIVALGAVVRGETPHFEYVAGEAASGLQLAGLETGVPVSFGVLTTDTEEQARERLDKGAEAVRTALEMADVFSQLRAAAGAAAP